MSTLSEHRDKIQAAIDAAESDGFFVTATTCCCGEGLIVSERGYWTDGEYFELVVY